jgi:hypothetical protein
MARASSGRPGPGASNKISRRKNFGNLSAISPLSSMTEEPSNRPKTLTPDQRAARDAARRADAEQAVREREAARKAFHENYRRLKAERLAREARATQVAAARES